MRALAEALSWPCEEKRLVYNWCNRIPNLFLGSSGLSLDRTGSSPLQPPWPDLVIAASRRSAPIARWIRKKSGDRTRLVHLLHTQSPPDAFDLIITTPQYRLPERDNILHNVGPLNRIPDEELRIAGEHWQARLGGFPKPRIALLVGGSSSSYELDAETAGRLGTEANRHAEAVGGSLLISTSPRTPAQAADALLERYRRPELHLSLASQRF